MSREINTELKVVVFEKAGNIANDLYYLFDNDEDNNGNNGEDYLIKEAKKKGFKSNFEYWISEAIKNNKVIKKELSMRNLADVISEVVEEIQENDGYYSKMDYEITEICNKFVVSMLIETIT